MRSALFFFLIYCVVVVVVVGGIDTHSIHHHPPYTIVNSFFVLGRNAREWIISHRHPATARIIKSPWLYAISNSRIVETWLSRWDLGMLVIIEVSRGPSLFSFSLSTRWAGFLLVFFFICLFISSWLLRVRSLNDLYAEAKVGETTNKQQLNDHSETTSRLRPAAEEFFCFACLRLSWNFAFEFVVDLFILFVCFFCGCTPHTRV